MFENKKDKLPQNQPVSDAVLEEDGKYHSPENKRKQKENSYESHNDYDPA